MTLFWCKFGFGKCFGASSCSNRWDSHQQLLYKIHFSSYVTVWLSGNDFLLLPRVREMLISQSVWLFVTPWTVAHQASLSMGFSRQEYWGRLPVPPPGIFLTQGLNAYLLQGSSIKIKDETSKWQFFWFAVNSWGTHLSSFFTFPICFKCWMTIGWLTMSSSAICRAVSGGSTSMITLNRSLSTSGGWPLHSHPQRSNLLQKFLNHHWTVRLLAVPGWNVLMLQVVSAALWPTLN